MYSNCHDTAPPVTKYFARFSLVCIVDFLYFILQIGLILSKELDSILLRKVSCVHVNTVIRKVSCVIFLRKLLCVFFLVSPCLKKYVHVKQALKNNVPHHLETSQLICNANRLTGFYMMGNIGY